MYTNWEIQEDEEVYINSTEVKDNDPSFAIDSTKGYQSSWVTAYDKSSIDHDIQSSFMTPQTSKTVTTTNTVSNSANSVNSYAYNGNNHFGMQLPQNQVSNSKIQPDIGSLKWRMDQPPRVRLSRIIINHNRLQSHLVHQTRIQWNQNLIQHPLHQSMKIYLNLMQIMYNMHHQKYHSGGIMDHQNQPQDDFHWLKLV